MEYDYSKLYGRMREQNFTQKELAKAANMSETTLNAKLTNKNYFTQSQIWAICDVLGIAYDDIPAYFFAL